MPAHPIRPKSERTIRKEKAAAMQMTFDFSDVKPTPPPMKEWISEQNGHHWRWRSWGTHAECIPID